MKKTKYILSALIALIIMLSSVMSLSVCAETNNNSLGYRTVSYQISSSDLENYADGGRSGLDISLRSSLPKGVTYSFKTEERQVTLTLHFEFESAKDYREKVIALCGEDTSVICSLDDGFLIVESAEVMNYLDFLFEVENDIDVENGDNTEELPKQTSPFDIRSMMSVVKNVLFVNGTEHQIEGKVDLRPEISEEDLVRVDHISLHTEGKRNGSFKRTVEVVIINDENEEIKRHFQKKFKKLGRVKEEQTSNIECCLQVSFEACGWEDLSTKTEKCLGCKNIQIENFYPIDNKNVRAVSQEFYDLAAVLNPEGTFSYVFDTPSYYSNVQAGDEYTYITEGEIASQNELIKYSYEKKFCFDEILILTDISNPFGTIERTIRLSVSNEIADFYHENVKNQLSDHLAQNSVMTISKDAEGTHYEISFSSNSAKKILEFTNDILDYSGELKIERGFLGISNEIYENISVDSVLSSMSPARTVSSQYVLPSLSSLSEEMEEYDMDFELTDNGIVKWKARGASDIVISYSGINVAELVIFIVALLVLLAFVLLVIKYRNKVANAFCNLKQIIKNKTQ